MNRPLCHGSRELGLRVLTKELERARGGKLLPHKQHGCERAGEGHERRTEQLIVVEHFGEPVARARLPT